MYRLVGRKQGKKQMTAIPSNKFCSSEMHRVPWDHIAEADDLRVAWRALRNKVLSEKLTDCLALSRCSLDVL